MGDTTQLELDMAKCQIKVYEDMHTMRRDVHAVIGRVSELEKGHKNIMLILKEHETQRRGLHEASDRKLDAILAKVSAVEAESNESAAWISKANKWRLKITFAISGIVGTLGAMYWLYTFLEKNGFVFILERATP